jgi:release factor glutamine methyltransferase
MSREVDRTAGSIRDRLRAIEVSLKGIGAGNPRLEAEFLVCRALGRGRVSLLTDPDGLIPSRESETLEHLLDRRLAGEPLAYVLGNADFMGIELEVGPGVLIPRSETERLVEVVEEEMRAEAGERCGRGGDLSGGILDVGTGSGAILIALAMRNHGLTGVGIDLSEEALAVASRNIRRHGLGDRLSLAAGDLMEPVKEGGAFDAVVSNPPYIRSADLPDLPREIRDHEPRLALDGGRDGMEVLRRLASEAAGRARPFGVVAFEISPEQGPPLREWIEGRGRYETVKVLPDLAGRDRFLVARRRG